MKTFDYWNKLSANGNLVEFSENKTGLLWLKLKSIIRVDLTKEFLKTANFKISSNKQGEIFRELFEILSKEVDESHSILNDFIKCISKKQIADINIEKLVSELYKLKNFEWGGDYQNSLDKYLVSRYIKTENYSYDNLISKFDTEINSAVKGYVLNSWYNYWSSILIENIFKLHKSVLPTAGKIKSVDFFIDNIPFDLKVTYLPAEYIKLKRKEKKLPTELAFLKQKAKEANIVFNEKNAIYEIMEKFKDKNNAFCKKTLRTLKSENLEILQYAKNNPRNLIKWLYENQGEMRFGSENRIFIILIDTNNFNDSWKLKRNLDLLKPKINLYLDSFKYKKLNDLKINFNFKDNQFYTFADIIFVENNRTIK